MEKSIGLVVIEILSYRQKIQNNEPDLKFQYRIIDNLALAPRGKQNQINLITFFLFYYTRNTINY